MKHHRGKPSVLFGALACVVLWPVVAFAAVPAEHDGSLKAGARPGTAPAAARSSSRKLVVAREGAPAADTESVAGCRRLPATRAIVKLNLKPNTDIVDLVAWISSITCRQFLLPGTVLIAEKKVTVTSPQLITPASAYRLFLSALDSVGLTVQKTGRFYRVIETAKAKSSPLPLYGFTGELLSGEEDK